MSSANPPRLVLVDGSSLIYRAFFALPANFSTTAGLPTNAIYGFATMFRKLLAGRSPDFGAVVFDAPGPSFRAELYPEYKAQRPPMPPALREQLPHIDALVDAHAMVRLRQRGYEADDLIGSLTRLGVEAGMEVQIISGDKDFAQLIGPRVRMVDTLRDVTYDEELVRKKWGVHPEHFVDWLALCGDRSDNIPGVEGIGHKGAAKLLAEHGSLDAAIAAAESGALGGRAGKALLEQREQARLSQALARIDCAVPLELDAGLESLRYTPPSAATRNEAYRRYEFYSLLGEEAPAHSLEVPDDADYELVYELDQLEAILPELRAAERVALLPFGDEDSAAVSPLVGVALSPRAGRACFVPIDGVGGLGEPALSLLRGWLEDAAASKLSYDGKRAFMFLRRREPPIELRGLDADVQLESFLVDPTKIIPHALPEIVKAYLHTTIPPRKRVTGAGKSERPLSEIEPEALFTWACARADAVSKLGPILREQLREREQLEILEKIELPLARALGRMELAGVLVDPEDLEVMGAEFRAEVERLEEEIHALAGHPFNIRSTQQLSTVLFDELGLPVIKRTKSGYSTNAEVLERLRPQHPIAALLLEHRKLTKLINTYTDVLAEAVRPSTGRIHCVFQQTVGATGRLISTDPDLQRTPVKTPEGARIRQAFIAPPGHRLVAADWSQIELRLLAHVSEDPKLVAAFREGRDVHAGTAAELFDTTPDAIDKAQRDVGKLVNFSTIYGQGATALAQILGIERKRAQAYIDRYFRSYAAVRRWLDQTIDEAHARGYVSTLIGRRRYIPELSAKGYMERQAGERIAANTPIQGSAADLCKQAMLEIDAALNGGSWRARMLIQVHDELVFEAPDDEVGALCDLVRDKMEHAWQLRVPLRVDVGVGRNWREAKG